MSRKSIYIISRNSGKKAVARYCGYDAFGNEINPDANGTNPYRYCGEYYDFESGTIYLRARYYSPTHGRFTQPDRHWNTGNMIYGDADNTNADAEQAAKLLVPDILAIRQSSNLYVYCGNNPVCMIDMWGESYTNAVTQNDDGTYNVVTLIDVGDIQLELVYTIDKGVIRFDFSKNDYSGVLKQGVGKELASAMIDASRSISGDNLSGRTSGGIDTELKLHWAAYKLNIKADSAVVADMGGTDSRKGDYDSNAWFFQSVQATKIMSKYNIYLLAGIIDVMNEVGEYMR